MLTFAADSWRALGHCVGEHSANVAGRLLNALCPLRGRLCHDVSAAARWDLAAFS
jgi:hypothetical protein